MKEKQLIKKLNSIYDANVYHKTFIDKNSVLDCMMEAYFLGVSDSKKRIVKDIKTMTKNGDFIFSLSEIIDNLGNR